MNLEPLTNEIIEMYTMQNMTTVEIAKKIGCSSSGIGRLLRRNNIIPFHTPNEINLSDDDIKVICERYRNGETSVEICKDFNLCDNSIVKILKANGVEIREAKKRSPVECHNYFETIDSVDKAYFLGWMISDGSVIEQRTRVGRANTISLEIHRDDEYILKMFANAIKADESLVKRNSNRNHSYIRFASSKMSTDLSKYGVIPRKTNITYLPNIPSQYMSHLIRGYFDGNGTITINRNKNDREYGHVGFYGSEEICLNIVEYLHTNIGIKRNKVSKATCYHVWWGDKNDLSALGKYLYKDCEDFYLKRKYDKFKKYF